MLVVAFTLVVPVFAVAFLWSKREHERQLARMTTESEQLRTRLAQLEQQLTAALRRVAATQEQLHSSESALVDLRQRVAAAERAQATAILQATAAESDCAALRAELDSARKALADLPPPPQPAVAVAVAASPPASPSSTKVRVRKRSSSISHASAPSSPLATVASAPRLLAQLSPASEDDSSDDGAVVVLDDSGGGGGGDNEGGVVRSSLRRTSVDSAQQLLSPLVSRSSGSLSSIPEAAALSKAPQASPPVPRALTRLNVQRASVDVQQLWARKWHDKIALLVRVQALLRGATARRAFLLRRRRVNIVNEIVETERSYVAHLQTLVDICRDLLAQCIMPQRTVCKIFINSEVLLAFNKEFLAILSSALDAQKDRYEAKIANVFSYSAFSFRAYVYFVSGYADAVAICQKTEKTLPKFKQFLAKQEQISSKKLDFYDLLIMPVQRVPRYCMLLAELRRFTPDSHADAGALDAALQELRQLAAFIDGGATVRDRLLELSAQLAGWRSFPSAINRLCASEGAGVPSTAAPSSSDADVLEQFLHPARRLIKEGHAIAAADGKLRMLILMSDHLLVCKVKSKKTIKVKQLIVLTGHSTLAASEHADFVLNGVRFRLQSVEGRQSWMAAIQSAIAEQETLEKVR